MRGTRCGFSDRCLDTSNITFSNLNIFMIRQFSRYAGQLKAFINIYLLGGSGALVVSGYVSPMVPTVNNNYELRCRFIIYATTEGPLKRGNI
jgi:hypothetical protein